eukprot:4639273-Amphidinium_carterae.1
MKFSTGLCGDYFGVSWGFKECLLCICGQRRAAEWLPQFIREHKGLRRARLTLEEARERCAVPCGCSIVIHQVLGTEVSR